MKIVIDRSVPFVENVFEPYADVVYKEGRDISREDLAGADVLLTGTHIRCDGSLLKGTSVKMLATASIGMDHIDQEFCEEAGIHVSNAFGSDANSVMNYVFSALYGVAARKSISLDGKTFGVIGVGSSGSKVAVMARYLGFRILLCDPQPSAQFSADSYCSMDELLDESDIVSLHVPLTERTRELAGHAFFDKIKPGTIFINASRGELVDEDALMFAIPKLGAVVIDTWNNEPHVNEALMDLVDIATPHIAGFSYQAKQNVTATVVRAVARYFGISELFEFFPQTTVAELAAVKLDLKGKSQGQIASEFQYNYPVFTDDFMFRMNPYDLDGLRNRYNYRREFFVDY